MTVNEQRAIARIRTQQVRDSIDFLGIEEVLRIAASACDSKSRESDRASNSRLTYRMCHRAIQRAVRYISEHK